MIGSIPFMAIDRYASRFGIDDRDSFARFLSIVRRMDMAYIGHLNKKAELNNKKD